MRGLSRLTLVLIVFLVAATSVTYMAWRARQPSVPKFCAGVGLFGPPAASPRAALDSFLGHDSSPEWRQRGTNFINTSYSSDRNNGYQSIQVAQGESVPGTSVAPDQWTVQGACV